MEDTKNTDFEEQRREIIAQAVAAGMTINEIHRKYGVPPVTLRAWKRTSEFQELVEDYTKDQIGAAKGRLLASAIDAADELIKFIGSETVEDRHHLAAIELLLSYVLGGSKATTKADSKVSTKAATTSIKGLSKETVTKIKRDIMGLPPNEPTIAPNR